MDEIINQLLADIEVEKRNLVRIESRNRGLVNKARYERGYSQGRIDALNDAVAKLLPFKKEKH